MKKATTALAVALLLCLSPSAFSQYIFEEDFQQGIPGTWTVIDVDGLDPDSTLPLPSIISNAWIILEDIATPGDSFAASTSKYLPTGQANDWLITPAITTQGNSILVWYANALAFITGGDGYEVRVSTTTPTVAGFLAHPPLFSIASESTGWTKRSADLSGYPNQTVYLAFRNNSLNRYVLGIDDVAVFDCGTITADAGVIDTGTTVACSGFTDLDLNLSPRFSSGVLTTNINGNSNDVPSWFPLEGRPFEDDGGCCNNYTRDAPYQIVQFQVTVTGSYTINQTQNGYDGVIYLYTDPLDLTIDAPGQPTTYIAGNDDHNTLGTGFSEIVNVTLTQGVNYYLISSGYEETDLGNYTTTFTGPGSLMVQDPNGGGPFDYSYIVSNTSGTIVSIGDDLTNTTVFPGSMNGDTFTVCGIAYISANINLASYVGLAYSVLVNDINGNSCAALTGDCYTAVVLSGNSTVDAGIGDTVCAGTPVFLTATGGVSYQWSTTDTTANIEVIPFFTTIYSVTAVDNIGCTASDNVTVKVFSPDGGKFLDEDVKACEGEPDLNLDPAPEYSKSFALAGTNIISGNTIKYTTWDPLPGRPFEDGTCCSGHNTVFDIQPFQVDETGRYTFNQSQAGYDGIMFLYTDPFDITSNPPFTFVIGNDDGPATNTSVFDTILQASTTYYLVSTGFSIIHYGNYITAITGPGNLLLPIAPDSAEFGYEYLIVENGIITDFTKDLTNAANYPGSVSGTDYEVCAVSYLRDSVNISLYLNQPFANLSGVTCLDPSSNCIKVTIFTEPVATAGVDDTICFNTPYTLDGNQPAFGSGQWSVASGNAAFINFRNPNTIAILDTGLNVLVWTIDNGGCTDEDTIEILVTTPELDAGVGDTICYGESTTLTATGDGPFAWSTGDSTASTTVTPDETTTYIVFSTAANGCTASDNVTVVVNQLPVVDVADATVCPGSTTVLDAGHPGSTYLWSNGDTTQTTRVPDGTYSVTLTDLNGCTNSDTAIVTIGSGLTVVINDVTQCEGDTAVLNAGNAGAHFTWSTGDTTQIVYAVDDGTYSVTVVDDNNCTGSDSATITLLQLPQLTASNDEVICEGESVTLTASGTGSLRWSTNDTTGAITVSPVADSTFTVTVTGGNGCTRSDDILVTVNQLPNADAGADVSICGDDDALLTASGGDTYAWNNGETTAMITVSPAADSTYIVTVTSSDGCSATDTVEVTVRAAAAVDAGAGDTICAGETTVLQASGGGTYLWENGNANSFISITPSVSQYYSVTVTAPNGCQGIDSAYVQVNAVPVIDFDVLTDICLGTGVTLSASGGDTYLWSTNATTSSITVNPTSDQTYSVTASTNAGCSIIGTTLVQVVTAPVASVNADTTICEGATLILTASGGTDYHWSTNSNDNPLTVSPVVTTTYSVTVSNAAGCEDVADVTVTVNDVVDATLFGFDTTVYCLNHAPIIIAGDPTGGSLSGNGVANGQFNPKTAGVGIHTITYTLLQPNGCSAVASVDITVDPCNSVAGIDNAEVKVYPNPTENFVMVEMAGLKQEATIRLYDPVGRLLLTEVVLIEKKMIDLSPFAAGTYLLQITSGNDTMLKRIVKND